MNKKYLIPLFVLIVLFIGVGFFVNNKKSKIDTDRIEVITSFYPLYFFASQIAGDKAIVSNIIPSGAGPHGYEPTARDIANIENSDLFILNGEGLESWGENIKNNLIGKRTHIVVAGEGLASIENSEVHEHEDEDNHEKHDEDEHHHVIDPHIWLSPLIAMAMADKIEAGLSLVDPENSSYYKNNNEILKNNLSLLNQEFKKGLSMCTHKNIVVSHAAFGYLAKEYGLNQIPIAGLSSEEEPSSREMIKITKFAKDNNVKYIFFESLVSPKLSVTIANEIGAKTLVLNPIGGLTNDEIKLGKDYFSEMRNNLNNLRIALECQ